MESPATRISRRLADNAEAVCRRYLSKGHREGRYWLIGDVHNNPGRSLYVRLVASPDGRSQAGKWTDAENGDHGDLLDIIAASHGSGSLRETLDEARRFLALPQLPSAAEDRWKRPAKAPSGTPEAARRLVAMTQPIGGSIVAAYLSARGITCLLGTDALRFHPRCWYCASKDDPLDVRPAWPAMIAAVTDLDGAITGVHRTWLDPRAVDKAPVAYPRRAMGHLLGNGVRFGIAGPVMVAGEGIETILSLRMALPVMPAIAGLSANHLAAILFPPGLRRLYVARDDDPGGDGAVKTLTERACEAGIEAVPLEPMLSDFNDDLRQFGPSGLQAQVRAQLSVSDREQFLMPLG